MKLDLDEGERLLAANRRALKEAQDGGSLDHYLNEADGWEAWLEAHIDALLQAAREAERLREALRDKCITYSFNYTHSWMATCGFCKERWPESGDEEHVPGCLAEQPHD